MVRAAARTSIVVLAVAASACAGQLDNPARFAACEPGMVENLFATKCGACHGANEPEVGLDLVSTGVAARLVEAQSFASGPCNGRSLISRDGDHLLLEKLEAEPSCGNPMPMGTSALAEREVECVRQWIDAAIGGAP